MWMWEPVSYTHLIKAAGCVLPLSNNLDLGKDMGTRHRACLGIAEDVYKRQGRQSAQQHSTCSGRQLWPDNAAAALPVRKQMCIRDSL